MKIEDLPSPANYRRQMAKNGGYEMVPAYTAEEVLGILEGVEKDAERYRWIRAEHLRHDPVCHLVWKKGGNREGSDWVNTANLDLSIDAAIKKGQV